MIPLLLLGLTLPQSPSGLVLEPLDSPAGPSGHVPYLVAGQGEAVYMTWMEDGDEGRHRVRFSVLERGSWRAPVDLATGVDLFRNWADFPSVCARGDGALLSHWLRRGDSSHGYRVELALSTDDGRSWSSPFLLHNDRGPGEHGFVSLVALDDETFGAIWLDGREMVPGGRDEMELYFRTVGARGELGDEVLVDPRACSCCQTGLTKTASDELLAVYRDRTGEEIRDVSLARRTGEGWSPPSAVHTDGWKIEGCPVNGPRIDHHGSTSAVAWYAGVGEGGGSVLLSFLGGSGPIDVDDGLPIGRVDVVFVCEDSVVVTWLEHDDHQTASWRVRRVWRGGRTSGALRIAEVPGARASGFLRMARTPSGPVLAWTAGEAAPGIHLARLTVADEPR